MTKASGYFGFSFSIVAFQELTSIYVSIFLRQVVYQRGIPFEVKLKHSKPGSCESLTDEQFNVEIEKRITDLNKGNVVPGKIVAEKIRQDYGV